MYRRSGVGLYVQYHSNIFSSGILPGCTSGPSGPKHCAELDTQ